MSLERVIHQVELQLFHLGRTILQGGPGADAAEELELLQGEINRCESELAETERQTEEVRARIAERVAEAALLPSLIEDGVRRGKTERAMRLALELDKIRAELTADRAALPRLEHLCWSRGFRLRELHRRMGRMRQEMRAR